MKKLLFIIFFLPALLPAQKNALCDFEKLFTEGKAAASGKNPDYELALKKFNSARRCDPAQGEVVDAEIERVFAGIKKQKEAALANEKKAKEAEWSARDSEKKAVEAKNEAQAEARRNYANDMAYKSQIALRDGDRTSAFRLAEFAHRYVDDDNDKVTRALLEAFYYNDNPAHSPLVWNLLTLEGLSEYVLSVAFSPNGKWLAAGASGHTAKIWDLQSGKELMTLEGHTEDVNSVAFSPNGKWLATGAWDHTAKIWDLQSGKELMTLEGHASSVISVAFSPDGKWLATASVKTAKTWDLESGKTLMTLGGTSEGVLSVAFSPDGKWLATGEEDNTAKIWDLESSKTLMTLEGHSKGVNSVAISPNGKWLATGAWDNTAKIWNLESGKALMILEGHASNVISVAFSPNGKWLATASDNSPKIWDLESGKVLMILEGHAASITSVAFSPNGKWLATASYDNTAKIWDLKSGVALMTLERHSEGLNSVAFSHTGKWLATADDNTAKIWDLESGKALMTLEGHLGAVSSMAFSPNGKWLVTGSYDHTAKIWKLDPDTIIQQLHRQQRLTNLTQPQLDAWDLEGLLNLKPGNEALLCQTNEIRQIVAFAEQAAQNTRNSQDLTRTARDYTRAARLYQYAIDHDSDPLWSERLGELYTHLAIDILTSNRPDTALRYALSAYHLCPLDTVAQRALAHARLSAPAGQGIETEADPAVLRAAAEYLFETKKWHEAEQVYEKAEAQEHHAETLLRLYEIGDSNGQGFDFQRFLRRDNEADLRQYALYFAEIGNSDDRTTNLIPLRQCLRISERLLEVQNTLDNRILVAGYCNDLAWNLLFTGGTAEAETVIRRGMALDPENKYLQTNLPHALLLQDDPSKEAEALRLYAAWKEKDFGEQDLPKYKDAFLDDIRAFGDAKAIPESQQAAFTRAKQLLENE